MLIKLEKYETVASLERLLIRWPFGIRIKLKLAEAKKREARSRERESRHLRGTIRKTIMDVDLKTLRAILESISKGDTND